MGTTVACQRGVLTVVPVEGNHEDSRLGKRLKFAQKPIVFGNDDLERTTQPHDIVLVVTA